MLKYKLQDAQDFWKKNPPDISRFFSYFLWKSYDIFLTFLPCETLNWDKQKFKENTRDQ